MALPTPTHPRLHRGPLKIMLDEDRLPSNSEMEATLREALDDAAVTYRLVVHEGAAHGFAVLDFAVYDPAAAQASWDAAQALFERTLR